MSQNLGIKVQESEVTVVCMGQTSKYVYMIIIPANDSNNQHVPDPMSGSDNWVLSLN